MTPAPPDGALPPTRPRAANTLLWASAAALTALILWQAARVNDRPALADMAIKVGSYSMVTTQASNAEVLAVVDDRSETLTVYAVLPGQKFEPVASASLPELFTRARGQFRAAP